ncbi:putative membrane-spanning 4-domains subfamily A member 15 [Triplophysa rosa]|uniref:Membrane-spanning 4-domains subfamily A member 15 n=1 Tax=Triplophysa rosa TaxID=992332 RepID=A0A9W7WYD7_TRIRA|nr:putative membrane-spanning 4-domains subfamily A member 15 [Triplophysa rosa]
MSVTVSTDLSVTTAPGRVEEKIDDKRNALQESLRKGEPKIFGVSQIALGLLIISYSMPLLFAETSLIINIGVPWWSGLMFVFSGATAFAVEKHASSRTLTVCLTASVVAIIVSLIAIALYYFDIGLNLSNVCINFSSSVKNTISILIMAQTAVSSAFTAILYKVKKNIPGYTQILVSKKKTLLFSPNGFPAITRWCEDQKSKLFL